MQKEEIGKLINKNGKSGILIDNIFYPEYKNIDGKIWKNGIDAICWDSSISNEIEYVFTKVYLMMPEKIANKFFGVIIESETHGYSHMALLSDGITNCRFPTDDEIKDGCIVKVRAFDDMVKEFGTTLYLSGSYSTINTMEPFHPDMKYLCGMIIKAEKNINGRKMSNDMYEYICLLKDCPKCI